MATAPDNSVSVLVVDGTLGALHKLGFPLPALASMQEEGVQLTGVSWNVRKTTAGLSVSFFWPSQSTCDSAVAKSKVSKSKKRRLRRKKKISVRKDEADSELIARKPECLHIQKPETPSSPMDLPSNEHHYSFLPAECECESTSSQDLDLDITLCNQNPELIIPESQLSPSDIAPPVFYHYNETKDVPGMCVDLGDGSFSWSPIKVSRCAVKVGVEDSSGTSDLDPDDCLSFDYQPRDGVPGFHIETPDDAFWAPVAHRTRKRLKTVTS